MTTSRKLTARSVVLSVLLGSDPPRLPVQLLVRTTELFGISDGTTRTALSRMAAAGELRSRDGAYEIADPRLRARQARQAASRAARTRAWRGGRWVVVVVGDGGRRDAADRAEARAALATARLAELREGVWLRPDNLEPPPATGQSDGAPAGEGPDGAGGRAGGRARRAWAGALGARTFLAVPDEDPGVLAAALWDLGAWAAEAEALRRRMGELLGRLDGGDTDALGPGFVLSADVLRHFQHDPLLPAALLPDGWPGDALRTDYDRYDASYRDVLRRWFATTLTR